MDLFRTIALCLGVSTTSDEAITSSHPSDNKIAIMVSPTETETADRLISAIFASDKLGKSLGNRLEEIVKDSGLVRSNGRWYEGIAKVLLQRFESLIKDGQDAKFTGAVKEAFDKAQDVVNTFVHDHPVLTAVAVTLLVLGLLMYAAPWAVQALGFTLDGPLEGKCYQIRKPSHRC